MTKKNELYPYFKKNECFLKKKDERVPTLLLLDGFSTGRVFVSDENYRDFIAKYSNDISNGFSHFISEQRSTVYKMFMDNDFIVSTVLTKAQLIDLAHLYQSETKKFYLCDKPLPESKFDLVILDTTPRNTQVDGKDMIKMGYHFIFPNLFVDDHQALQMRESYLIELKKKYKERSSFNTWSDVLDKNVYMHNGLRMAYSFKSSICLECNNVVKLKEDCLECNGKGRIAEERSYKPLLYLSGTGHEVDKETQKLKSNIHYCVSITSIRTSVGTNSNSYWKPYVGAPMYNIKELNGKFASELVKRNKNNFSQETLVLLNEKISLAKGWTVIDLNDEKCIALIDFVRNNTNPMWNELETKQMSCNKNCDMYTLRVQGIGSSFCLNKNKDHTSATIYFTVTQEGVRQRCYSKKDTQRIYCKCSGFYSTYWKMPYDLCTLLFSDTHSTTKTITILQDMKGMSWESSTQNLIHRLNNEFELNHSKPSQTPTRVVRDTFNKKQKL